MLKPVELNKCAVTGSVCCVPMPRRMFLVLLVSDMETVREKNVCVLYDTNFYIAKDSSPLRSSEIRLARVCIAVIRLFLRF